jgi:ABC-type branched-subunit amino acid transport system ATPase component
MTAALRELASRHASHWEEDRAMEIADRTYVLELGQIAFAGPSAELSSDPRVAASYLGG